MTFNEDTHEYYLDEERYTPVTRFLEQFKPPFQAEMIAGKVAKKEGVQPEEILEKWEMNKDISIFYGNAIHKGIEYWIKTGEVSKIKHIAQATKKFSEKYKNKLNSEIVVFDKKLKIAGTLDVIVSLGNKKIGIVDIKTNAELEGEPRGKFLPPLDLPYTKINEYRLQQSMYKYLAEKMGLTVEWIKLEHWNGTSFRTIDIEPINVEKLVEYQPKKKIKIEL